MALALRQRVALLPVVYAQVSSDGPSSRADCRPRVSPVRVPGTLLHGWPVVVCLAVGAALRFYALDATGQNLYYAAAVRSMTDSWHNFFFGSFDPSGALMIDKPAPGLWLQVAAVKSFGFHYWALALPQAVAGVLSVGLLYVIVRPRCGSMVAFLAAFALAVMPASVASARNNSVDTLTMFLMLISVAAFLRFVERDRARWLALAAIAAGLAFNTKMFAAFVALPAFAIVLMARGHRGRADAMKLAAAGLLLLGVSFSWVTAVAVTPTAGRPAVYNGYGNDIWALTLRYNGFNRIVGQQPQRRLRATGGYTDAPQVELNAASRSAPRGPQRLLTGTMGTQVGWFIPVALLGCWSMLRRERTGRLTGIFWASWLAIGLAYFSLAADTKPQYLEAVAAPVAVCAALGLRFVAGELRRGTAAGAAFLLAFGGYSAYLLSADGDDTWGFALAVLGLAVAGCVATVLPRRRVALQGATVGAALTVLALVTGPLSWSTATAVEPATGSAARYPVAGPDDIRRYPPDPGGDAPSYASAVEHDPAFAFLEQHTRDTYYLVATERALFGNAARYVVIANRPVLTLDSFSDQHTAATTLGLLVDSGRLRFLELPALGPWSDAGSELGRWFARTCQDITSPVLRPIGGPHLYQCGPPVAGEARSSGQSPTA